MSLTNTTRQIGIISLIIMSQMVLASSPDSNENTQSLTATTTIHIDAKSQQQSYSEIQMHSNVLAEERELLVHLPDDYHTTKRQYPVIYLLDGNRHFSHAMIAERILQQESLTPESIIVAIPNMQGTRSRDLSAKKDAFLTFIEQEVFNLIETNFRVSGNRTIFGHSMAGYFVLNVLADQPNLFDNYIAASPVIQVNNSELITKYNKLTIKPSQAPKSLYLTLTDSGAEGKRATEALNEFVELMKNKSFTNITWHYEYIPNQTHMSTPYLTLYEGLSFVFSDYRMPRFATYLEYERLGGLRGLNDFYANRASKYLVSSEVPEAAVRRFGNTLLDDGQVDKAVKIFKMNHKSHPDSIGALNALASGYEAASLPNEAMKIYEKALKQSESVFPQRANFFKRQILRLESKSAES